MNPPSSSPASAEYFARRRRSARGRSSRGIGAERVPRVEQCLLDELVELVHAPDGDAITTRATGRDDSTARPAPARSQRQTSARPSRGERQRRLGLDEVLRQVAAAVDGNREARGRDPDDRQPSRSPVRERAATSEHEAAGAADQPERIIARASIGNVSEVRSAMSQGPA